MSECVSESECVSVCVSVCVTKSVSEWVSQCVSVIAFFVDEYVCAFARVCVLPARRACSFAFVFEVAGMYSMALAHIPLLYRRMPKQRSRRCALSSC